MERITTPCVNFCWIEPGEDICEGCGRTRAEVAQWCFITEDERRTLMPAVKERLAKWKAARAAKPEAVP
jgi:predicted Fe-S protein YdhL (DUF1289 family)